ncbi:hypothetical protein EVAR_11476_1 [Eumeta japonica]|uniref:Uncharacterized protein n=1 Tax=Eumeta variegata TaxID=151549 RepID=A0A4C1TYM4_EUMVA|nr:hypothetical protein EVAR_11476_1 [Eumeta japonica]
MSTESKSSMKKQSKKRKKEPLNNNSSEDGEDNEYVPYSKKNHIRSHPDNSPEIVFPVYIQSTDDNKKFECADVIKHIPTDLTCQNLFDKLISSQEILSVRCFTKKTPEGIILLQTVSLTFSASAEWTVSSEDSLGNYHFPTIVKLAIITEIYDYAQFSEKFTYKKADWI